MFNHFFLRKIFIISIITFSLATVSLRSANNLLPTIIPLGSSHALLYELIISNNFGDDIRINNLIFSNESRISSDQIGISLIKDSNQNFIFDNQDTIIKPIIYANSSNAKSLTINNIIDFIPNNSQQSFFLTIHTSTTADYGASAIQIKLISANAYSPTNQEVSIVISSNILTRNIMLSSLENTISISREENIFFEDSPKGIFFIQSQISCDNNLALSFDIFLNSQFENSGYISLFSDITPILSFNNLDIFQISNDLYSEVTINIKSNNPLYNTNPNYHLLSFTPYRPGVSGSIILKDIQGMSSYTYPVAYHFITDNLVEYSYKVHGLEYQITDITPSGNTFIESEIPIIKLELTSYFSNSTVNFIQLFCTGDIGFNEQEDSAVIKYIYLYNDTDNNGLWDKEGDLIFKTFTINDLLIENDKVILTIDFKATDSYSGGNSNCFFITYLLQDIALEERTLSTKITDIEYLSFYDQNIRNKAEGLLNENEIVYSLDKKATPIIAGKNYSHSFPIPAGSQENIITRISVNYTGIVSNNAFEYIYLDKMTITNLGEVSPENLKFYLYEDLPPYDSFDPSTDRKMDSWLNTNYNNIDLNITINTLADNIVLNSTKYYYVLFDINLTANYGLNALKFKISNITYTDRNLNPIGDATILSPLTNTYNFMISTLLMEPIKSITTINTAIAQETTIATLSFRAHHEMSKALNFKLTPYATLTNNLGLFSLYRYEPLGNPEKIHLITTFSNLESEIIINDSEAHILHTPTDNPLEYYGTKNYLLKYSPLAEIYDNCSLNFTFSDITGIGDLSNYFIYANPQSASLNFFIAGIPARVRVSASIKTINHPLPRGTQGFELITLTISYFGVITNDNYEYLILDNLVYQNAGFIKPISYNLNVLELENNQNYFLKEENSFTQNYLNEPIYRNSSKSFTIYIDLPQNITCNYDILKFRLSDLLFKDKNRDNHSTYSLETNTVNISISGFDFQIITSEKIILIDEVPINSNQTTINLTNYVEDLSSLTFNFSIISNISHQNIGKIFLSNIKANGEEVIKVSQNINSDDTISLYTSDLLAKNNQHTYSLSLSLNNTLPAGTTVNLKFISIQALGYNSQLPLNEEIISCSMNTLIAGLLVSMNNSLPNNTVFIGNMEIPVLSFQTSSFFTNSTLNNIILSINGNIYYTNSSGQQDRIEALNLYINQNSNQIWDEEDLLIKNFIPNNSTNGSFEIPTNVSIIPSENKTLFHLTVKTGPNCSPLTQTNIYIPRASYLAENKLLQTIPVNAYSPIELTIREADIFIPEYLTIFEDQIIPGAINHPILKFNLRPINNIPTYNLILKHNFPVLNANDTGIKQIMLIEDLDQNNVYSKNDIIHTIISTFNNSISLNLTLKNLDILKTYENYSPADGYYHFLLLYDLGQSIPENIMQDLIKPELSPDPLNSVKTALIGPIPRSNKGFFTTENRLNIELEYLTPSYWITENQLSIGLKIINNYSEAINILDSLPQFYLNNISSLNATYLFNINKNENYPLTLAAGTTITLSFLITPNLEYQKNEYIIDGYCKYEISNNTVIAERKNIYLWKSFITNNNILNIQLPEEDIFYLEYPNYIQKIEITNLTGTITQNFRNGELIDNAKNYFKVSFKNHGAGINLEATKIFINEQEINFNSDDFSLKIDSEEGAIFVGPFNQAGQLKIYPQDIAGNKFPVLILDFYTSSSLFIKNLLPYPSKIMENSFLTSPLLIGFLISKPSEITTYIFNSRGEIIWNEQTIYLTSGYKTKNFNGVMNNGQKIPKGMYIIKLVGKEIGKDSYDKNNTKFIVN